MNNDSVELSEITSMNLPAQGVFSLLQFSWIFIGLSKYFNNTKYNEI